MKRSLTFLGIALVAVMLFALAPAASAQSPLTVQVAQNAALGQILTDNQGRTLYLFTKDQDNVSNCYDQCAVAWPPLLVAQGAPAAGAGLTGTLGVIERKDGGRQVVYNGMPLYYFVSDANPGDTTGQGVKDVWFVVHPSVSSMTVANPVVQVSQHPALGDILTSQGMTLYWFKNDTENTSTCYDQCAVNWPPLLAAQGNAVAGTGVTSGLGVIERTDGTHQVTYNGLPLYFFIKDSKPWDANGQGVKDVWFVVHPSDTAQPAALPETG
jgi:predicted lipoprotein with Yx(FWY)xxD motif